MHQRFLPAQRLRQKAQFQNVFVNRQRKAGKYYIVYYKLNTEGISRLGMVAAKRNVKLAVKRNQWKRIARDVFRKQCWLANLDIVLVATPRSGAATKQELRQCLQKIFTQLTKHSKA